LTVFACNSRFFFGEGDDGLETASGAIGFRVTLRFGRIAAPLMGLIDLVLKEGFAA